MSENEEDRKLAQKNHIETAESDLVSHSESGTLKPVEFCKIDIDDFVSGKIVLCDLYIRLGEGKYVKIVHRDSELPSEQIAKYKKNKLIHFYMSKADLAAYLGMNLNLAQSIKNSKSISKERKMQFMKHTVNVVMESIFSSDVDESALDHARIAVENTIAIISEDDAIFNLLEMLNDNGDYLYAHSLGVSLYSSLLARKLTWSSPQTQFKVSVGGLLHDIGKKEIPTAIRNKSRTEMNLEELAIYETHPLRGMEILSEIRSLPDVVLQIVLHHHENCLGQGFPCGLKINKTNPLARVIAVADAFCTLGIKSAHGNGMPTKEALERMLIMYSQTLDPVMLRAFLTLFKVNIAPKYLENLDDK